MKYKLINKQTGIETLCDKVTIDGFDYYVSSEDKKVNDFIHLDNTIKELPEYNGNHIIQLLDENLLDSANALNCKKVIATNNSNIDIPKVVDENKLRDMLFVLDGQKVYTGYMNDHNSETALGGFLRGCRHGYTKSQETHSNSDEDMIEFAEWISLNMSITPKKKTWYRYADKTDELAAYTTKELLQLWKEQQTKTLYYE